jgi:hypothetical protein
MDSQQLRELLKSMGVDTEWAEKMLVSCAEARNTLKEEICLGKNDETWLLNLESGDIATLRDAMTKFSGKAKQWVYECVKHMIGVLEKQKGTALPPFTVCGIGSFGREEMSPYSDCDLVILCVEEKKELEVVNEFAEYFSRAITAMRNWASKLDHAASFSLTFELAHKVMTPLDLANSIPADQTAIPDVFSIYEHHTNTNQLISQFYQGLITEKALESLQGRVQRLGLDGILSGRAYEGFTHPKARSYNIKNAAAFFQRVMAVMSVIANCEPQDSYLPGATWQRLQKFMKAQLPLAELFYYQLVAIRFEMHLRFKGEVDRMEFNEPENTGKEKTRLDELRKQGLDDFLVQLNLLLKGVGT